MNQQIICRMKCTVFWDVVPCNLVEMTDISVLLTSPGRPVDEGSKNIWNVAKFHHITGRYVPEDRQQSSEQTHFLPFVGPTTAQTPDRGMARSDGTLTVNQPIPWGTNVTWPPSERRKLLVTISKQDWLVLNVNCTLTMQHHLLPTGQKSRPHTVCAFLY
jgi:hypothetical protein